MYRVRWWRFVLAVTVVLLLSKVSTAANFSFIGAFIQDDDRQNFTFTSPGGSVTIRTWSYAGGTNAAGSLISAGGFDPLLSVFDSTGGLIASSPWVASNDDPGCGGVAADPTTLNCFDAKLVLTTLDITHTYTVVLTQSFNAPNGATYGDGFSQDGTGNFTASAFGCGASQFCDATPAIRNGNWAVDILGVGGASGPTTVPEPAGLLTVATGFSAVLLLRRRRRQQRASIHPARWR